MLSHEAIILIKEATLTKGKLLLALGEAHAEICLLGLEVLLDFTLSVRFFLSFFLDQLGSLFVIGVSFPLDSLLHLGVYFHFSDPLLLGLEDLLLLELLELGRRERVESLLALLLLFAVLLGVFAGVFHHHVDLGPH